MQTVYYITLFLFANGFNKETGMMNLNKLTNCMRAACKTASYRFHELHGPLASLGST